MENKQLKIRDRVIVVKNKDTDPCIDHYAPVGATGTVVYADPKAWTKQIAVEFDDPFKEGHNCSGTTKDKRGQWYEFYQDSTICWEKCLKVLPDKKNNYY